MKTILFTLTLLSFLTIKSMACEGNACPMSDDKITPEKRTEMAAFHTQMAACLSSDKPMEECHKLMADHMGAQKDGTHSCADHDKTHKDEKKSKSKK